MPSDSSADITHFYAAPESISGDTLYLGASEARHALKALRLHPGDDLVAVDGMGGWYRGVLVAADNNGAEVSIRERKSNVGEPSYRLHVGLGVLKNTARFETFVEKAVELGVTSITPLQSRYVESKGIRADRLHRIMVAALKQCGRTRIPVLEDPCSLGNYLTVAPPHSNRMIFHEKVSTSESLLEHLSGSKERDVYAVVGPEGGFTEEEVKMATASGWKVLSLGARRLRAETAAISVAAIVSQVY